MKNGAITRGVLVDIPGTRVRREEIEAWEKRTGVKISAGDALLLRSRRGGVQPPFGSAGYEPSMLPLLKERDIALLGHDSAQEGGTVPGVFLAVHGFALVALGVHLLDNLDLEALAETAAKLKRWEFMLTIAPLRAQKRSRIRCESGCYLLSIHSRSPNVARLMPAITGDVLAAVHLIRHRRRDDPRRPGSSSTGACA